MSEQNETKKEKSKISSKPLERVTIEEPQKEKLTLLTSLANESLNGMATISKSDLVNMILEQHPNELSKLEIEILRKSHLDIFKHLSWLQAQAKLAKESGNDVSLAELMKKSSDFLSSKPLRSQFLMHLICEVDPKDRRGAGALGRVTPSRESVRR